MKLIDMSILLRNALDDLPDDLSEEEFADAMQTINQAKGEFKDRIGSMIAYSLELDAEVDARNNVIANMSNLNKQRQDKANRLRDFAKMCITAANMPMPQVYSAFKISWAKMPQIAIITNEAMIPNEYKVTTTPEPVTKIDKKKLNDDVKAGVIVAGAKLSEVAHRLAIK